MVIPSTPLPPVFPIPVVMGAGRSPCLPDTNPTKEPANQMLGIIRPNNQKLDTAIRESRTEKAGLVSDQHGVVEYLEQPPHTRHEKVT